MIERNGHQGPRRRRKRPAGNFARLPLFQQAMDAAAAVFTCFSRLPEAEQKAGLARDAVSASRDVCNKIASAHGAKDDAFACVKHLRLARRRATETMVFLEMGQRLGHVTADEHKKWFSTYRNLTRRLDRLIERRTAGDEDIPF